MLRRNFCISVLAAGGISRRARAQQQSPALTGRAVLEGFQPGQPYRGKVLLAVQAHSDDIPLFASGTVAKLIEEGYTGYLVRATNDDMGDTVGLGTPGSTGEHALGNERDNAEVARVLGCKVGGCVAQRSDRTPYFSHPAA